MAVFFMAEMEFFGLIGHYHISAFMPNAEFFDKPMYLAGLLLTFTSTMFITVYFATSMAASLREGSLKLMGANTQLKEHDKIKSQYVLMVSHDIKAALGAIQSCLGVVLEGLTGKIPKRAEEMVLRAEKRSVELMEFLHDLLDLSKIRSNNKIIFSPVNPVKIAEESAKAQESLLAKKGLKIEISARYIPFVKADPKALRRVFDNLIFNAIRYNIANGSIAVNFKDTGEFVEVTVADTGDRKSVV